MKAKRYFAVIAALICLCGCNASSGSEEVSSQPTDNSVEISADQSLQANAANPSETVGDVSNEANSQSVLSGVYSEISNNFELPEMIPLNDKLLNRYYGLTPDVCSDYAGGVDGSGVGQDEIALFKAADESQVAAIEQALQTRYDSKLSQQENYNPDEAEKIRNCKVETKGLYVTLIISNDAEAITELVFNSVE